jgi:hypothetical protein
MIGYCSMQKYTKNSSFKCTVEKIVEKFGREWKKMENYTYLCID